jgi:hypothetical protein
LSIHQANLANHNPLISHTFEIIYALLAHYFAESKCLKKSMKVNRKICEVEEDGGAREKGA